MSVNVSILISTHNRADILRKTLESVAELRVAEPGTVEVIVVPNACTDQTVEVLSSVEKTFPFSLRWFVEPMPGLSIARNRCMAEARGEIFAFIDDDVRMEPDWLSALIETYRTTDADVVGGPIILWWEAVQRPTWMDPSLEYLLSAVDNGADDLEMKTPTRVYGANFSFHRRVFDAIGGFDPARGRNGKKLLAGEETDYLTRAMARGYRLFYSAGAGLKHWVLPERASIDYLKRVAYGNGYSQAGDNTVKISVSQVIRAMFFDTLRMLVYSARSAWARIHGQDRAGATYAVHAAGARGRWLGLLSRLVRVPMQSQTPND